MAKRPIRCGCTRTGLLRSGLHRRALPGTSMTRPRGSDRLHRTGRFPYRHWSDPARVPLGFEATRSRAGSSPRSARRVIEGLAGPGTGTPIAFDARMHYGRDSPRAVEACAAHRGIRCGIAHPMRSASLSGSVEPDGECSSRQPRHPVFSRCRRALSSRHVGSTFAFVISRVPTRPERVWRPT